MTHQKHLTKPNIHLDKSSQQVSSRETICFIKNSYENLQLTSHVMVKDLFFSLDLEQRKDVYTHHSYVI